MLVSGDVALGVDDPWLRARRDTESETPRHSRAHPGQRRPEGRAGKPLVPQRGLGPEPG